MSTIDHLTALADRIRTEAYIADRPGQMGRLEAIAYELEDAEEIIRADERERLDFCCPPADKIRSDALDDLRAKVEGLGLAWVDSGGFRWVRQAAVLALLEEES